MDEWGETEGEKNGQSREGAERGKAGTGRCPFGLLPGVRLQLGPRGECVLVCLRDTVMRLSGHYSFIEGLEKDGGLRGQQR